MLKNGTLAPTFETFDVNGEIISLKNFLGKKIHISFFRNATCPLCNLRYFKLKESYTKLAEVKPVFISIFESSAEVLKSNLAQQQIPYPLLPDPHQKLYTLYGLENSWRAAMTSLLIPRIYREANAAKKLGLIKSNIFDPDTNIKRMPAEFLINEEGLMIKTFYSRYVGNFLPIVDIEDFFVK